MKLKKKPFQPKLKTIEEKLWALCKRIVLLRDGDMHGRVDCYTCTQKNLEGQNRQLGHGFPKGALGASMKFNLKILRYQCYRDNIHLGGMGAVFWKQLEREMGKPQADALYLQCQASKGQPVKARDFYIDLIEKYKKQLEPYTVLEKHVTN